MRAKPMLRSVIAGLFAVGVTVAEAGTEVMPATGEHLREAALMAARQRSVVEVASRETARNSAASTGGVNSPLSCTRRLNSTEVTLDFCSGSHLVMTSNLDSVTELIVR